MLTLTQQAKTKRNTPEYKAWKKDTLNKFKLAHSQGQDVSLLATCPDSYQLALKVKYNK